MPGSPMPDTTPLDRWLDAAWAQTADVHEVEVEGATVRYRGWGLDATDKPGLIFVHGFLAHARWWDHIAPHFTDRFRVAALDFTGMGDSDRRPEYFRRQYGREILAVAQAAGMDRVTLAAHSFGAVAALYAASLAPERVERAVIIDAHVFRGEIEKGKLEVSERTYASRAEAIDRYRLIPPGTWPVPRIVSYLAENSMREDDGDWRWKFDPETLRSFHTERLRDDIRGLDLPVDFVHAADSEVVGPAEIASFLENMPRCHAAVTVPLSHHHIMIEQPVGLVAALNGIFAKRD
ncbi:alpha/beta hydrolase (plasmid) [Sphingomonas paeninsulae]|jgi:pimeloyl-ACP methyl ester carboxylesterase|uniref:Alpha/beta hydrolase n=1 Tax=Sphingomonas paeninsulae TaxID=2319844 RepID=A0A494TDX4_SPHPE|nr:alpha/beta hydrolase [Sphingomonas paeninsulae]AYJ85253.1 alpha/beta hydrolase [Sphingomonas paeninsulae]